MSQEAVSTSPVPSAQELTSQARNPEPFSHLLGWDSTRTGSIGFRPRQDSRTVAYPGSGHQITIGKTGSGKAVNALIPQALTYPGSMIIFDPKREIEDVTRRYREKVLGQKTVILNPFSPETDGLNPLDLDQYSIDSAFDFASSLATLIAGSNQRSAYSRSSTNDDFWIDSAVNLLTGIIGGIMEGKIAKPDRSLNSLVSALKSDDVVYSLAVTLDTASPSEPFKREIASLLQMVEVTRSGVLATAQSYLRGLSGLGSEKLLAKTTFDLEGLIHATVPTTIYIQVPLDKLVSHSRILRLIFGSLMTAMFARPFIPAQPTLFALDEAAALGTFEPLRTMLTTMRGQGVIVHSLWQDLAQIEHNYADWETILNNQGVIRLLGASNYRQAVRMADIFGVSPQKLIELKPTEQIIFVDGQLVVCQRLNYLSDEIFAGRFDPNSRYGRCC
jgi:type IV secretion system protein VirD4